MIINHNLGANNAIRNMSINSSNANKSMQKLSSGLRINTAADDAAGLAISEKMRGQIRGLDQATSNAQDATNLIGTAEGALNETTSILQRMRELAVQSSTDTNTTDDRAKIQSETDQLAKEITRISNTTEFNTQKLINGGVKSGNIGELNFQIGANKDQNIQLNINAMDAYSLGVAGTQASASVTSGGTNAVVSSATVARDTGTGIVNGASISITAADVAAQTGSTGTVAMGTGTVAVTTTGNTTQLNGYTIKFTQNDSAIATSVDTNNKIITVSADFDNSATNAPATTAAVSDNINTALTAAGFTAQVGVAVAGGGAISDIGTGASATGAAITGGSDGSLTRITLAGGQTVDVKDTDTSFSVTTGAYKGLTVNLSSGKAAADLVANGTATVSIAATGSGAATFTSGILTNEAAAGAGINVSSQSAANNAITAIDNAINTVSQERSKLGAYSNRLDHTIANLGTSSENLTSAESRIRDVDMAKEMATFSKNNILAQAAQAMLAQANQQPQQVLQLLR
jgi:flagellin